MAGVQTGLAAQLMIGEESTWGVPVAPTIGLPLVTEKMSQQVAMLDSKGIIAGAAVERSSQWALGMVKAGGDIGIELYDRSLSTLFKHMFGNVSGGGPFTYTPVAGTLTGKGLTVQVGRVSNTGSVDPYTYAGSKVASWEIACASNNVATLGLSFLSRCEIGFRQVADGVTTITNPTVTSATAVFGPDDVGKPISSGTAAIPANTYVGVVNSATSVGLSSSPFTNTPVNATASTTSNTFTVGVALAAASYAAGIGIGMTFVGASATIAGAAYKTQKVSLKGDNGLNERAFNGQRFIDEPLESKLRSFSGQIDSEYFSTAAKNRFVNGTEAALVLNFALGTSTIAITTNARFSGATPQVNGTDVTQQSLPFDCVGPTTDASAITAVVSTA